MLILYQSNRLEKLADALSALATELPLNAMQAEQVVVPHAGLGRWLKLYLADRTGICSNLDCHLPGAHAWRVFRALFDDLPAHSPWEPGVLTWRILDVLPAVRGRPGFAEIDHYLADADELMALELAERLARVFDQYLLYRPDWINAWEAREPPPEDWQGQLWRLLAGPGPDAPAHWVNLVARAVEALGGQSASQRLPRRAIVFGVASLSPGYLELLTQIARAQEVHLFVPAPCAEFWGDVVAERDLARVVRADEEAEHYEVGNALLASLGGQGRDFFDQLGTLEPDESPLELWSDPGEATALRRVQSDLLHLRAAEAAGPLPIDDSIRLHACHSPLRELEVLHDQLLSLFESLPDLKPADILVMSPDVDAYAPFVESVFGAAPASERLPFAVLDAGRVPADSIIAAFSHLLAVAVGRMTVSEVLQLLECPALARRFAMHADDLTAVHAWVRDTGVRWGRDGAQRSALGLPATQANTWRFGLDAMLLGLAMGGDAPEPVAGVLPYPEIEGDGARVLGGLCRLLETLEGIAAALATRREPARWAALARTVLERCFEPTLAEEAELAVLRECIAARENEAEVAGFEQPIAAEVFFRGLTETALAGASGAGFPSGSISFCSMVPLRSVPFRVICLLGMNDGAFPRRQNEVGFDRMRLQSRRGDRSRREDDRYLFLETLLSARDTLIVSHVGQHQRSNEILPPSVLVTELTDYLARAAGEPWPLQRHPLQAFSARYFSGDEPGLFSYRERLCAALAGTRQRVRSLPPLVADPEPAAAAVPAAIGLDELRDFARNPARSYLRARGIRLPLPEESLPDEEPFLLAGLERWQLADAMLSGLEAGEPIESVQARLRAAGRLPHGLLGEAQCASLRDQQVALVEELASHSPGAPVPALVFESELAGIVLSGRLEHLRESGLALVRAGTTLDARVLLALWLQHLLLNVVRPPGIEPVTCLVTVNKRARFDALEPERARLVLTDWVEACRDNLSRPLPFLPNSSFAFTEGARDGDADAALAAAVAAWLGGEWSRGEGEDPWYAYLYREDPPFGGEFARLGDKLCAPALAHLSIEGGGR